MFEVVTTTIERARGSRHQGGHLLVLLMPTKEEVDLPQARQAIDGLACPPRPRSRERIALLDR